MSAGIAQPSDNVVCIAYPEEFVQSHDKLRAVLDRGDTSSLALDITTEAIECNPAVRFATDA